MIHCSLSVSHRRHILVGAKCQQHRSKIAGVFVRKASIQSPPRPRRHGCQKSRPGNTSYRGIQLNLAATTHTLVIPLSAGSYSFFLALPSLKAKAMHNPFLGCICSLPSAFFSLHSDSSINHSHSRSPVSFWCIKLLSFVVSLYLIPLFFPYSFHQHCHESPIIKSLRQKHFVCRIQ